MGNKSGRRLIGLFSSVVCFVEFDEIDAYRSARDEARDKANPLGSDCNVLKSYFTKDVSNIKLKQCTEGKNKEMINNLSNEDTCERCIGFIITIIVLVCILVAVVVKSIRD